ncbi:MAG: hypothetical protein KAI47_15445 [Deltaproteobacteria bacterium]|nr:hypothetical protein [Deltaproteobacteria bacterium]
MPSLTRSRLRLPASGHALMILGTTILFGGCNDRPVHYTLTLSGALPASVKPQVKLAGVIINVSHPQPQRWVAHFTARHRAARLSRRLAALRVILPTPCGPIASSFRPANPGYEGSAGLARFQRRLRDEEVIVARHGEVAELRMFLGDLPLPPPFTITVDRRDAPTAITVALGAVKLARGAGLPWPQSPRRPWNRPRGFTPPEAELYRVFAPRCPEGRVVRIAGRVVGRIPPRETARGLAIIDIAGRHDYWRKENASGSTRSSSPPPGRTLPKTIPRGHLHTLAEGPPAEAIEMPFPPCPEVAENRSPCASFAPASEKRQAPGTATPRDVRHLGSATRRTEGRIKRSTQHIGD